MKRPCGSKGVRNLAEPFVREATAWASCRPYIKIEASLDFEVGLAMLASESAKPARPPVLAGTQAAVLARSTTTPDPVSLLDQSWSGLSLTVYLKKIRDKDSNSQLKVREIHALEKSVRTFGDPFVLETGSENTAKISRVTMCSSEC